MVKSTLVLLIALLLATLGNSLKLEKAHNSASNLHADAQFDNRVEAFISGFIDQANSYDSDEDFTRQVTNDKQISAFYTNRPEYKDNFSNKQSLIKFLREDRQGATKFFQDIFNQNPSDSPSA